MKAHDIIAALQRVPGATLSFTISFTEHGNRPCLDTTISLPENPDAAEGFQEPMEGTDRLFLDTVRAYETDAYLKEKIHLLSEAAADYRKGPIPE